MANEFEEQNESDSTVCEQGTIFGAHTERCDESNALEIAHKLLSNFDDLKNVRVEDNRRILFDIDGNAYALYPPTDMVTGMPYISTIRISQTHPHILPIMRISSGAMLGSLCLFESNSIVALYLDYKEKVALCISQLLRLTSLSRKEKVIEYQKEFLYYWNNAASEAISGKVNKSFLSSYCLFLSDKSTSEWLNVYNYPYDVVRLCSGSIWLNDTNDCTKKSRNWDALYLPILDASDLIPPTEGKAWGPEEIVDIICGVQIQRISLETYKELSGLSYSKKAVVFIFMLHTIFFGCAVEFRNSGTAKFTVKIESQIEKVIPIHVERVDFEFLTSAIGNQIGLLNRKVIVVGAGSLGSYVCEELVRSGVKNLTIIDFDKFEPENLMRHRLSYGYNSFPKAIGLSIKLKQIHPEVVVNSIEKYVSGENLLSIIPSDADMIIFTVGGTDIQIELNRALKENAYEKPVLFAWLEGDGESSHVASVEYNKPGCFECLFTDEDGKHCECTVNVSNGSEPVILRNGCGGTRVAYGNGTLLSASKIVLEAMANCFSEGNDGEANSVISFVNGQIVSANLPAKKLCGCCGIRNITKSYD